MTLKTPQIGCLGLPPRMGLAAYFSELTFLETDVMVRSEPSVKALRSWRKKVPKDARFSLLIAPAALSQEEADRVAAACEALRAEAVVLRSDPQLAPSSESRERLERWFGELASADRLGVDALVWEPRGPWEPVQAARFSAGLGVCLALDPLAPDPLRETAELLEQPPAHGLAYYRLHGLGRASRRFEAQDLERLADLCTSRPARTWVGFGHLESFRDARRFRGLLAAG